MSSEILVKSFIFVVGLSLLVIRCSMLVVGYSFLGEKSGSMKVGKLADFLTLLTCIPVFILEKGSLSLMRHILMRFYERNIDCPF